ncbi:MAG: hypothetical protein Q8P59_01055 [Dehalococcoidia bacterium]|nr:hypothetical protein [Dehalococcoidia bacterium]
MYTVETNASVSMPGPRAPAKGALVIPALLEFEAEESMATVNRVQPESLDSEFMPSGHVELEQPSFQDQEWLFRTHENGMVKIVIPRMEWPTKHDPILTDLVRKLLTTLWAIVVSRALQAHFPLAQTTVSVFHDPTEQESKAILRLTCTASGAQAIAFWDSLEPDLHGWLQTLKENDRTTFISKLGLRVHWQ